MIRIGFAYNQKPVSPPEREVAVDSVADGALAAGDDEPPSSGPRDRGPLAAPAPHSSGTAPAAAIDDVYAEWDSPATVAAVEHALSALGQVTRLEATDEFPERLRALRPDIVFNIAEGLRGVNRESHVPAICEFYGIPYSGSDPFTLSLCLDKARAKETLAFHGVPTASFALVRDASELARLVERVRVASSTERRRSASTPERKRSTVATHGGDLTLPLFVKPVHEGSSKGITEQCYCATVAALEAQVTLLLATYAQPVIVEEYLPGREFTCGVLGNGDDATVLPIVAINFAALPPGALPVYGYEAKWIWDRPDNPLEMFECPAPLTPALQAAIERVTLDAYRVLGCRDWSRVDVRLDADDQPRIVEVNPLPGILPDPAENSCLPKSARAAGLDYDALIQACLRAAAQRQGVRLPAAPSSLQRLTTASPAMAEAGHA